MQCNQSPPGIDVRCSNQTSDISRTKFQNVNVSRLVLQLYLPNPLKPGVKWKMKMRLEQRRQKMLQLHLNEQPFHCLLSCDLYWSFSVYIYLITSHLATDPYISRLYHHCSLYTSFQTIHSSVFRCVVTVIQLIHSGTVWWHFALLEPGRCMFVIDYVSAQ